MLVRFYYKAAISETNHNSSPYRKTFSEAVSLSKRVWRGWNAPNAIISQTRNLVATVEEL